MQFCMLVAFLILQPDDFESLLPHTHELIRREVVSLGGETESPEGLVFVAFRGKNFRPRHFEMLSHLTALKWFSCRDVDATPESLSHLQGLSHLTRLDLRNSRGVGDGICILQQFKALREVWLEDITISDQGALALARVPNLKELHLEDVELSDAAAVVLGELPSRGVKCDFLDLQGLSDTAEARLYKEVSSSQGGEPGPSKAERQRPEPSQCDD